MSVLVARYMVLFLFFKVCHVVVTTSAYPILCYIQYCAILDCVIRGLNHTDISNILSSLSSDLCGLCFTGQKMKNPSKFAPHLITSKYYILHLNMIQTLKWTASLYKALINELLTMFPKALIQLEEQLSCESCTSNGSEVFITKYM